jgi:hypothetical protein
MIKLTHSAAAIFLMNHGIDWSSSGNCSDRDNRHCTSFEQIRLSTVNGIIKLKQDSGCAIRITGGTETGHSKGTYSHWNGYKLDISPDLPISEYIAKNFTKQKENRKNHWDITFLEE